MLLFLTQCADSPSSEEIYETAHENAVADLSASSYEVQGAPYGCTEDCSGHDAGYAWAAEKGITDPADCGGNSDSFIEGCRAFGEAIEAESVVSTEAGENEY